MMLIDASVLVAMQIGFRATLGLALGLYLLGYLAWRGTLAETSNTAEDGAGSG